MATTVEIEKTRIYRVFHLKTQRSVGTLSWYNFAFNKFFQITALCFVYWLLEYPVYLKIFLVIIEWHVEGSSLETLKWDQKLLCATTYFLQQILTSVLSASVYLPKSSNVLQVEVYIFYKSIKLIGYNYYSCFSAATKFFCS